MNDTTVTTRRDLDESLDDRRFGLSNFLAPALTFIVLLLLWEGCTRWFKIPSWLLPSPSEIWDAAVDWRSELLVNTFVTLGETLAGFVVAIVLGVPAAAAITSSALLKKTIYPLLLALQSVPKVAVAPLLALWIGFGLAPKVVVVFLVCFFPIVVSTATGLTAVPLPVMELIRSLSASRAQIFAKVRLPTALPHIFVGLKIAITFAVIGAVIGEFVGSESGLGYLILTSSSQSRTPLAFAALFILTIMSIFLYYAVESVERFAVPWADRD